MGARAGWPERCCGPREARDFEDADAELAVLAKALGHPARVRILRRLLARRACVAEILEGLRLSQATVSQHLKVLREAGLVRGTIDGPRVNYCADPEGIGRLAELVAALDVPIPAESRE